MLFLCNYTIHYSLLKLRQFKKPSITITYYRKTKIVWDETLFLCFVILLMSEHLQPVSKKEQINFLRGESHKSTPNHHYHHLHVGKDTTEISKTPIWENHEISCAQFFAFSSHIGRGLCIQQEVLKENCTLDKDNENHKFFQCASGNPNHKKLSFKIVISIYRTYTSWGTKVSMKVSSMQDQSPNPLNCHKNARDIFQA